MSITDWPADDRPREKMQRLGPQALSEAELLAIFLRVGVAGMSAVDMARQLLQQHGSLAQLMRASRQQLEQSHGMGPAKAVQLQAVLELARRVHLSDLLQKPLLNEPARVKSLLLDVFASRRDEALIGLYLDARLQLLACETLAEGEPQHATPSIRDIVRRGLSHEASALILAHNHPSGHAQASAADRQFTQQLAQTLAPLGLQVLDHFLVAGPQVRSFVEEGWFRPLAPP